MHNLIKSLAPTIVPSSHRKAHVKKLLETEWNLPLPVRDSILVNHFILYWSPQYLCQQLRYNDSIGYPDTIYKEGRTFKVVFHRCTAVEADVLNAASTTTTQVALSFRVPKHEYGIDPIVLVSVSLSATHKQKQLHAGHSAKNGKPCNHSKIKEVK